jgi:Divergent InlB B-repeat domain
VVLDGGPVVELRAIPANGSAFDRWTGPCADTLSPTCVVTTSTAMAGVVTLTARFVTRLRYTLTPLPTDFIPLAIDARGRVAGSYGRDAAIFDPGTASTTRPLPLNTGSDTDWSVLVAMNAGGDAAGAVKANGALYPFVFRANGNVEILTPNERTNFTFGEALAIDGTGVVYGFATRLDPLEHFEFTYDGTQMSLLQVDGSVRAASPSGRLVGCQSSLENDSVGHPAVFRNGTPEVISSVLRGCLVAVNDDGIAVGSFETFQDIGAYIWDGNAARMLPMGVATSAKHAAIWLGGAEAQDLNLISSKSGFLLTPR